MVNRLMDLVVLMAELSQNSDKSFKEMDKELLHLGYSAEEIEEATFWMSSYWRPLRPHGSRQPDTSTYRVLGPWENMGLDREAYGYLLRLQTLGIIDDNRFEKIMNRVLPFVAEKLSLSDVKALAGMVVFNLSPDELEDNFFDEIGDDNQVT